MSDFILEISGTTNILEIETSILDITNNLEIEVTTDRVVEVVTGYAGTVVYASDIIGLDNYLSNFIDDYEIDCGTP